MFRRGDPSFGEALRAMLEAMNAGGIYDHLGGGYARYSTDAEWLVPHFEKMLYDNAQILELLALVHSLWPDPTFAERARETVGWLMREMRVGDAFAASLDADQDGEEGLFYVWDEEEVDAALGDAARRFKAAYDVTRGGNWEDRTVLRRITPRGSPEEEAEPRRLARETLRLARGASEARPRRQGAGRLERPDHRRARPRQRRVRRAGLARDCARRVRFHHGEAARRRWAASARVARGTSRRPRAARRLCVDGPRRAWLIRGERRARRPRSRAPAGERGHRSVRRRRGRVLSSPRSDAADVPGARPRQAHDGATPSGVGLLAETFVRLWHLTDEARWGEAAEGLIRAVSGAPEGLGGSPLTLMSADMLARGGSVVIDGAARRSGGASARVRRAARARPVADRVAPRSKTVAERLAARGPAARRQANRDAVPRPDLPLPGHDAGSAAGAHGRAARGRPDLTLSGRASCAYALPSRTHDRIPIAIAPSRNSIGTGSLTISSLSPCSLKVAALPGSDPARQPGDIDVGDEAVVILDPVAAGIGEKLPPRRRPVARGLMRRRDRSPPSGRPHAG